MVETSSLFWLVSTQFLLYAVGWGLCSLLMREQRAAVAHWGAFMLLIGTGFVLVGERSEPRTWWAYAGSGVAFTAGYIALRRGLEAFVGLAHRDREHLLTLLAVTGLMLAVGSGSDTASWRVVVTYGASVWLFGRGLLDLLRPLRTEFSPRTLVLLSAPAFIVVAIAVERVVRQLLDLSTPLELHGLRAGNRGLLYGYLVGAAMFNFGFTALLVARLVQSLRRLSQSDPLTGLLNRRALEGQLEVSIRRARRSGIGFAVLALDLDHFKSINDTHGHPVGDVVLTEVARRLQATARQTDAVARTGGEEFIVLMPDTMLPGAASAAERLRLGIAGQPVAVHGLAEPLAVTASIGVALSSHEERDAVALLQRADRALYLAKAQGRNRVVTSPDAAAAAAPAGAAPSSR